MTSDSKREQQEHWNGRGGQRWVTQQAALDDMVRPFGQAALERLALQDGEHVLDIGCGCGETILQLAERVGPSGSVTGVDLSAPMLARARERAPSATLLCGDASEVTFGRAFDAAYSRFGVMFFADPIAAFRHFAAALVQRGRMSFVCWRPPTENPWYTLPVSTLRAALADAPLPYAPDASGPGPFAFGERERIEHVLGAAGFTAVQVEPFDAPVVLSRTGLDAALEFVLTVGPAASMVVDAGPEQRARAEDALRRALAPHLDGALLKLRAAAWVISAMRG